MKIGIDVWVVGWCVFEVSVCMVCVKVGMYVWLTGWCVLRVLVCVVCEGRHRCVGDGVGMHLGF